MALDREVLNRFAQGQVGMALEDFPEGKGVDGNSLALGQRQLLAGRDNRIIRGYYVDAGETRLESAEVALEGV
jgi:hypothetical protein